MVKTSSRSKLPFSFKAFLSHRYKSPDVNLYFFSLFSEEAEVQFEVDEGTFATNVTRLERMVRDADAFIGIYPFPGSSEDAQSPDELRKASRYFRLELDLVIRSGKPAIVFYDARYGDLIKPPASILSRQFDSSEVTGSGGFPQAAKHRKAFKEFCDIVRTRMDYEVARSSSERTCVGLVVPRDSSPLAYANQHIEVIESVLKAHGFNDIRLLGWPPVLDLNFFNLVEEIDWAIVDIGEQMSTTGIPALLHGKFIPMVRLKQFSENVQPLRNPTFETALFNGIEVGYSKDLLVWNDIDSLQQDLDQRLSTLKSGFKRISTLEQATAYFRGAALRKEAVFLSYSGKDRDIAVGISTALKKSFQKVFDYRDGESISPGKPWLKEIFDQLASSAIGIPLLSKAYFESGNCVHEAEQMVAQSDNGKLKLIPIKLYNETFDAPSWLQTIQYLRSPEYSNPEDMAKEIVRFLGA